MIVYPDCPACSGEGHATSTGGIAGYDEGYQTSQTSGPCSVCQWRSWEGTYGEAYRRERKAELTREIKKLTKELEAMTPEHLKEKAETCSDLGFVVFVPGYRNGERVIVIKGNKQAGIPQLRGEFLSHMPPDRTAVYLQKADVLRWFERFEQCVRGAHQDG